MLWTGVNALVNRAKHGDAQAWRFLHAITRDYLCGLAQTLMGPGWPHRSVQDLIQETWTRAMMGITEFRGGASDAQTGAMLRAWLGKIMKRLHLNGIRDDAAAIRRPTGRARIKSLNAGKANGTESRTMTLELPSADPTPSHCVLLEEQTERVRRAVQQLDDPTQRRVVELVFYRARTLSEVSLELHLTYDQVRSRLNKALAQLGRELEALA